MSKTIARQRATGALPFRVGKLRYVTRKGKRIGIVERALPCPRFGTHAALLAAWLRRAQ